MSRSMRPLAIAVLLLAAACRSGSTPQATAPPADAPYSKLPYTPSLDVAAMDRTVDPCTDLYRFACGGWQEANPMPADQASWSVYGKLYVDNQRYLWGILEDAAKSSPERTPNQQKIGDFFAACMDTAAVDAAGIAPLQSDLSLIETAESTKDLARVLGELHARVDGSGLLFGVGSEQDAKDSSKVIGAIYAGGLGLPDRDYYLSDDAKSVETRAK